MFSADCLICRESLGGDKVPVTMPCGHLYCMDCATFWFNQGDNQKCVCGNGYSGEHIIRLWYSSDPSQPMAGSSTQGHERLAEDRRIGPSGIEPEAQDSGAGVTKALRL